MAVYTDQWSDLSKWSFYIGSPISLFSYIFLVIIFLKVKDMGKPPGNMLLATIFAEVLDYSMIFITSIRYMVNGQLIEDTACKVMGAVSVYSWSWGQFYFTWLAFEIMYRILRPTDLSYRIRFIIYSIVSHLPPIILVIVGFSTDSFGISVYKIWSTQNGAALEAFYVVPFAILNPMHIVTTVIAAYKAETQSQKEFLMRYLAFVIVYQLIFFPSSLLQFLSFPSIAFKSPVLVDIATVFVAFGGLFTSLSRLCDPQILTMIQTRSRLGQSYTQKGGRLLSYIADPMALSDRSLKDNIFQIITEIQKCFIRQSSNIFVNESSSGVHDSGYEHVQIRQILAEQTSRVLLQEDMNEKHIINSFDPDSNKSKLYSRHENVSGQGGQFIHFTFDQRFVIKSLSENEYFLLITKIFGKYFDYLQKHNSLLVKIVGIFEVDIQNKGRQYFMIMKNVIPINWVATHVFDLKGSKQNRKVEKHPGNVKFTDLNPEKVYKDQDFNYYIGKLYLKNSQQLKDQLVRDIKFLQNLDVMDYSILIFRITNETTVQALNVFSDIENVGVQYAFGIIDFLQQYNLMKQIEHGIKSIRFQANASATDIDNYGSRLIRTVQNIIA